ncbi:MAG: flagellar biosynthesis protein FlhF [Nitrospinota bacterium]
MKKFEAADMKAALLLVKKSMGEDAVILSTRQFKKRGRQYEIGGKKMVEITAAVEGDAVAPPLRKGRLKSYTEGAKSFPEPEQKKSSLEIDQISDVVKPLRAEIRALRQDVTRSEPQEKEQDIKSELCEIKSMVSHLMSTVTPALTSQLRGEYEEYFLRLVSSGVSEKNAADLLLSLNGKRGESIPVSIARKVIEKLTLEKAPAKRGEVRVSSFTGPTGVGKTTTVAKIASELVFSGFKVGLVSLDTYRIAAADQLRIYAEIIGVPFFIVESPEELSRVVSKMKQEKDFILIDTVGRSHMDMTGVQELGSYFNKRQISNHLVINAGMNERETNKVVKNFSSCMNVDYFLFSKLDETSVYGTFFNLVTEWQRPVSYITTGQKVPEDIEKATPERLAGFILNPASTGAFYAP